MIPFLLVFGPAVVFLIVWTLCRAAAKPTPTLEPLTYDPADDGPEIQIIRSYVRK